MHDFHDEYGYRPLHYAASSGAVEACEALVKGGTYVDCASRYVKGRSRSYSELTPLSLAVMSDHDKTVEKLIELNAAIHPADSYNCSSALLLAIEYGSAHVVKVLGRHYQGFFMRWIDNRDTYTKVMTSPFRLAVQASHSQVCHVMIVNTIYYPAEKQFSLVDRIMGNSTQKLSQTIFTLLCCAKRTKLPKEIFFRIILYSEDLKHQLNVMLSKAIQNKKQFPRELIPQFAQVLVTTTFAAITPEIVASLEFSNSSDLTSYIHPNNLTKKFGKELRKNILKFLYGKLQVCSKK